MATDWTSPKTSDTHTNELAATRGRDESNARMDYTGDTNIPDGTIRWNKTNNRFEIWSAASSTWSVLSSKYLINVDTVDGYHAGNASGNVPVSNGTVNTNLNADLLDGQHGTYFQARANHTGTQTPSTISPQGTGSGLDADKLDGQHGTYFQDRANHTGTQAPSTISPQGSGSGLDADMVDGEHATAFTKQSTLTAKGDLYIRDATGVTRLPVGSDGQILTVDSALASGIGWKSPSGAAQWQVFPIGVPIQVWDHLSDSVVPPNSGDVIYVRLTAGQSALGGYNYGNLSSESVTGSAPLVVATAVISLSTSPLYNKTIHLINTEEAFIRARTVSGELQNDQMQNLTGYFVIFGSAIIGGVFNTYSSLSSANYKGPDGFTRSQINFNASAVARAGNETRSKNVSATWYLRIR